MTQRPRETMNLGSLSFVSSNLILRVEVPKYRGATSFFFILQENRFKIFQMFMNFQPWSITLFALGSDLNQENLASWIWRVAWQVPWTGFFIYLFLKKKNWESEIHTTRRPRKKKKNGYNSKSRHKQLLPDSTTPGWQNKMKSLNNIFYFFWI